MNYFHMTLFFLLFSVSHVSCSFSKKDAQTDSEQLLHEAQDHLQRAGQEVEHASQMQEISAALDRYLKVEQELQKKHQNPSTMLYEAIAKSYLLLDKPGLAYFYYVQAEEKDPRNAKIKQERLQLEKLLGIQEGHKESFFSYQELLKASLFFLVIAFIFGSCAIWIGKQRLYTASYLFTLFAALILALALSMTDAAPLRGIVVTSTPLYRLPTSHAFVEGVQSHQIAHILPEGTNVDVLDLSADHRWLTVQVHFPLDQTKQDPQTLFYLPSSSVRLIQQEL